jgi:hypothetical protein
MWKLFTFCANNYRGFESNLRLNNWMIECTSRSLWSETQALSWTSPCWTDSQVCQRSHWWTVSRSTCLWREEFLVLVGRFIHPSVLNRDQGVSGGLYQMIFFGCVSADSSTSPTTTRVEGTVRGSRNSISLFTSVGLSLGNRRYEGSSLPVSVRKRCRHKASLEMERGPRFGGFLGSWRDSRRPSMK